MSPKPCNPSCPFSPLHHLRWHVVRLETGELERERERKFRKKRERRERRAAMVDEGMVGNTMCRQLALPDEEDQALALATSSSDVFAATTELGWLCLYDLRTSSRESAVLEQRLSSSKEAASLAFDCKVENTLYVALASEVHHVDLRYLDSVTTDVVSTSAEDINQVVVNSTGEYLASADDTGEVSVVSLRDRKVFKQLRRGHSSICSCVAFRPRQPWELFSGGLDCLVLLWDFSRGKKKLELAADQTNSEGQVFNPPMIHSVAVPEKRELANHVAAARGDASIVIYDISKSAVKNTLTLNSLSSGTEGHTASVGHICFSKFTDERHLVSGGNDGNIILWSWNQPEDEAGSLVHWSQKHGKKINWTATTERSSENVLIADTSNNITIYSCSG